MRINPRNFYQRELNQLPPHFKNIIVRSPETDIDKMSKWIYENCTGRYSITKDVVLRDSKSRSVTVIGFEEPGDLTFFTLKFAQIFQN